MAPHAMDNYPGTSNATATNAASPITPFPPIPWERVLPAFVPVPNRGPVNDCDRRAFQKRVAKRRAKKGYR